MRRFVFLAISAIVVALILGHQTHIDNEGPQLCSSVSSSDC